MSTAVVATKWMDQALCVGADPEIWFDGKRRAEAKRICAECPVAGDCRARGADEYRGVWAGEVKNRTSVGPSPALPFIEEQPCGTTRGYDRHLRNNQPACARCLIAHRYRNSELARRVAS